MSRWISSGLKPNKLTLQVWEEDGGNKTTTTVTLGEWKWKSNGSCTMILGKQKGEIPFYSFQSFVDGIRRFFLLAAWGCTSAVIQNWVIKPQRNQSCFLGIVRSKTEQTKLKGQLSKALPRAKLVPSHESPSSPVSSLLPSPWLSQPLEVAPGGTWAGLEKTEPVPPSCLKRVWRDSIFPHGWRSVCPAGANLSHSVLRRCCPQGPAHPLVTSSWVINCLNTNFILWIKPSTVFGSFVPPAVPMVRTGGQGLQHKLCLRVPWWNRKAWSFGVT